MTTVCDAQASHVETLVSQASKHWAGPRAWWLLHDALAPGTGPSLASKHKLCQDLVGFIHDGAWTVAATVALGALATVALGALATGSWTWTCDWTEQEEPPKRPAPRTP